MADRYEYPHELYCDKCDENVEIDMEERTEHLTVDGIDVDAPYVVAICPHCWNLLCERDRDYTIIRLAKEMDGGNRNG